MTTTTFSVHPENDHRGGRHLRGYRVINSVEARVRDLDSLGHLLDSVVVAGGGNAVITDIRLVHEDTTALDIAARTKAWQDARRKATQLAELAGLVLGDPAFINEQSQLSPMPPVRHAMLESAAATPIEAGEMSVTVSLTVGFALVSQGEKGTAKKETAQKAAKKKSAQKKSGEKKAAKKK